MIATHNEHHSHRAKAKALTAGDQRIDSTHGQKALSKSLTGYDQGDNVSHLHS